jgi:hypothetical protein
VRAEWVQSDPGPTGFLGVLAALARTSPLVVGIDEVAARSDVDDVDD